MLTYHRSVCVFLQRRILFTMSHCASVANKTRESSVLTGTSPHHVDWLADCFIHVILRQWNSCCQRCYDAWYSAVQDLSVDEQRQRCEPFTTECISWARHEGAWLDEDE